MEGDENGKIEKGKKYISIHTLRGEGDIIIDERCTKTIEISIHALRGEGDLRRRLPPKSHSAISIHALRGEGDLTQFVAAL